MTDHSAAARPDGGPAETPPSEQWGTLHTEDVRKVLAQYEATVAALRSENAGLRERLAEAEKKRAAADEAWLAERIGEAVTGLRERLAEAGKAVREVLDNTEALALLLSVSDKPFSALELLSAIQSVNRTLRPHAAARASVVPLAGQPEKPT